ncbi:PAS domain-containing protein [Spirosoma pulveris]
MIGDSTPLNRNLLNEHLDVNFALQAARLGVWELNPVTRIVNWDDRCRALFGLAKDNQLPYEQAVQYIHPEDVERVNQAVQRAMSPQSSGLYDETYRTLGADDGLLRWVRFTGQRYVNQAGELTRFGGIAQDVSDQIIAQKSQQQRTESEARFRSLIEEAPVATGLFVGRELRIDVANELMLNFWGKDAAVIGQPLAQAIPEIRDQPFLAILDEVFTSGRMYEARNMRADLEIDGVLGTYYFDFTYKPLRDAVGEVYGIMNMAVDVTPQVVARQQLEESELFARTLFERSPIAKAVFVGQEMVIRTANQNMLMMWGKEATVIGQPFMVAVPELLSTLQLERLRQVLATGETFYQAEEKFELFRYGLPYTGYYEYRYEALRSASGAIYGVMCVASEVTQQVVARQQIEASEQLLRNLVLRAPIGISILNGADLVIELVNDTFVEIAGKPYDQLVGHHYWIPFAEAAPYYSEALTRVLEEGEPFSINEVELPLIRHGKEETVYVTFVYMPINDIVGNVQKVAVWVLENTQQVTERRKIEELVNQQTQALAAANEELAAINEELTASNEQSEATNEELTESNYYLSRSNDNLEKFAYVASHDLQEPLRKVQSFGDLLKERYGDQLGEGVVYLDRMQSAASRMSTLIRDLLTYSRISTQRDRSKPVSLPDVVDRVLSSLELRIQETGAVVRVDALPTVMGDPAQLEQLFQNLIGNALKFRRSGIPPLIQVRVSQVLNKDLPLSVKPARAVMDYHQIEIIDNGVGFDEKYLYRIFEVFQRLHGKGQFEGTGIGLAICEKVVANHGGAITATSQPGQGSTFRVYLPA